MLDETTRAAIIERARKIPIVDTLSLQFTAMDEGYCEIRAPRREDFDGVFESFHGGLLITIADSAACFALLTVVGAHVRLATTDMNIRFLAPCLSDVTAKARVIKAGRTLCPVEINLFDDNGKHVAVSQVTYMLLGALRDRPDA
jgi:uncharacterized protein (TIGR00369 family)